jgi:hypothetical protein
MDSVEVARWDASMALDPDESDKADVRHALLMDWLALLLVPTRRGQTRKLPTVADHLASLPWRAEAEERKPPRPQTPKELMDKINAVMRSLGGKPRGG